MRPLKPEDRWPDASEITGPIERLIAQAKAEFEREVDRIDGIPHVLRIVSGDGSEQSRAAEKFLNWLATKEDYALLREAYSEAFRKMLGGEP